MKRKRAAVIYTGVLFALTATIPTAGWAQGEDGMVIAYLNSLQSQGRLSVGGSENGALRDNQPKLPDGSYLEAWDITVEGGESATIDLLSFDLDPYLFVVTSDGSEIFRDDDGAGGCNSRITLEPRRDTDYRVVATTFYGDVTGSYTIRVSDRAPALTPGECEQDLTRFETNGRTISPGEEVDGWLTNEDMQPFEDDSYAKGYAIEGRAGEQVIIDLRSDDFDAYLHIVGPGLDEPVANDDGAGGTDSRLEFEFPETGRYVIIVNTYGGNETGKFTLSVRD